MLRIALFLLFVAAAACASLFLQEYLKKAASAEEKPEPRDELDRVLEKLEGEERPN